MKTTNIIYLGVGAIIGWYLGTNKRKETERALNLAKKEAKQLADNLNAMVNKNVELSEKVVTEDVQAKGYVDRRVAGKEYREL